MLRHLYLKTSPCLRDLTDKREYVTRYVGALGTLALNCPENQFSHILRMWEFSI